MHLVYPQILHNHCFLSIAVVEREIEDNGYTNVLWVNNVHYGLFENGEYKNIYKLRWFWETPISTGLNYPHVVYF